MVTTSNKVTMNWEKKFRYILLLTLVLELIWGGSGRIIVINGISFRYALFGFTLIYFILLVFAHKFTIPRNIFYLNIVGFLIYLIVGLINGLSNNYEIGAIISTFQGYLYLLLFFPLVFLVSNKGQVRNVFRFLYKSTVTLAFVSVGLMLLLLIAPFTMYNVVNPILIKLDLGHLDLTGFGLPRVFFKMSPYFAILSIFVLIQILFSEKKSLFKIFTFVVLLIATFSTLTMGIWVALGAGIIILLFMLGNIKMVFRLCLYALALIMVAFILVGDKIWTVLSARFSSSDSSLIIKEQQMNQLIDLWLEKPFLGHGFGIEVTFINDLGTRVMNRFELFWLEILIHLGIIGALIYLSVIFQVIVVGSFLYKKFKDDSNAQLYLLSSVIGLIMFCIVSAVNPFMNNPIGIFYLLISVVTVNVYYWEWKKRHLEASN